MIPKIDASRFGLGCALATPLTQSGALDSARLVKHATDLLARGCDSVTLFGTTGEGFSFGVREREMALDAFTKNGITFDRVVGGVIATTIEEAALQARIYLDAKCRALLLTPPFYFKEISDDGLFAWFADVFEAIGAKARDVILYHIPSVTAVPLSVDLIGRLVQEFPDAVFGVKDSSGDWDNAKRLLDAFANDLAILIGDERQLAAAVRAGGQGCISGLANIAPDLMQPLVREGHDEPRVNRLVDEIAKFPVLPSVKALIAHIAGDKAWMTMRPPLTALDAAAAERLAAIYDRIQAAKAA
jgi:4-hydroxy-tetrahydrodipicolinate synthase